MPTPPLSDELAQQAVAAFLASNNKTVAAAALGLPRKTFESRLKVAAQRGMLGTKPVLPGFRISQISSGPNGDFVQQKPERGPEWELPAGHSVKGVSALVDADGRTVQQWVKTRNEYTAEDVAERLKNAFADFEPIATPTPAPYADDDLLTLTPCNDWHAGMFSWCRETGTNWDLKIAEREIGAGIEDVIARSPASGTAIILGGGDLTHADNNMNRTPKSGNTLEVDGRHQKVIETAGRLMVRTIDAALRRHGRVIVRNLKGNHDEETAPAIGWFLLAWYRNEPRVTVDVDQSLFFYHRFGSVMLAATHGHAAKLKDMPQIMAHRRAEEWGVTRYRYAHGFHIHHQSKYASEGGGVVMESHQAPIPQDAWHYGSGFLSGRSLQSITYHKDYGEVGRVRVAMIDAERAPVAANDNQPQRSVA